MNSRNCVWSDAFECGFLRALCVWVWFLRALWCAYRALESQTNPRNWVSSDAFECVSRSFGVQIRLFWVQHEPCVWMRFFLRVERAMGWLRLVGSLKVKVFFAKEPYKRDDILQKRPIILSHPIFGVYSGKAKALCKAIAQVILK